MVGPLPVGRWGPRYALGATCESVNALMNLSGSSPFNLINLSPRGLSLSLSPPPSTHTPCLARLSLGASLGHLPRLAVRVGMLLNVLGSPAAFVDVVLYSYGLTGMPRGTAPPFWHLALCVPLRAGRGSIYYLAFSP